MRRSSSSIAAGLVGLVGLVVAVGPDLAGAQAGATVVTVKDFDFTGSNATTPAAVSVAAGAPVTFAYPAGKSIHDVHFAGAPPACTGSQTQVGGAPSTAGPGWSATCTFSTPGVYNFFCDEHNGMTGKITVTVAAATPPAGTPPPATPPPSTPPRAPVPPPPGRAGLIVAATQVGTAVHGQVAVAHGNSTVTASLRASVRGAAARGAQVVLGSLSRRGAKAGVLAFAVRLSASGRRALAARRRLTLTLTVKVARRGTAARTFKRRVVLRAPHAVPVPAPASPAPPPPSAPAPPAAGNPPPPPPGGETKGHGAGGGHT